MAERQLNLSLMDLATFPVSGFLWLLAEIRDLAEREVSDPETISRELLELEEAYEAGDVDETEYSRAWAEYTERLKSMAESSNLETSDAGDGSEEG